MVTLALQFLSRQPHKLLTCVYVVCVVSFGLGIEHVWHVAVNDITHIVAHTKDEQRMPHGYGVFPDSLYDVDVAFLARLNPQHSLAVGLRPCYRHHVCKMMSGIEAEYQIVVDDGILGIVQETPDDDVCE